MISLPLSGGWITIFIMVSGPGRCPGRPGGVVRYLVSACLLCLLLYLPEARASYYPQSGECKGKGRDCTGKRAAAAAGAAARPCVLRCDASVVGVCTLWNNHFHAGEKAASPSCNVDSSTRSSCDSARKIRVMAVMLLQSAPEISVMFLS